jgi:hypothetical protein
MRNGPCRAVSARSHCADTASSGNPQWLPLCNLRLLPRPGAASPSAAPGRKQYPVVKVKFVPKPWRPTERNIEVLAAVCASGSRKDAARVLVDKDHPRGISVRTVGQHVRLLMAHTNAVSVAQLCLVYRREIEPYLADEADVVSERNGLHVVNGDDE